MLDYEFLWRKICGNKKYVCIFAYRFEKRLVNDIGISIENAKWAVSAWCAIYGKEVLNKPCDIEFVEMID